MKLYTEAHIILFSSFFLSFIFLSVTAFIDYKKEKETKEEEVSLESQIASLLLEFKKYSMKALGSKNQLCFVELLENLRFLRDNNVRLELVVTSSNLILQNLDAFVKSEAVLSSESKYQLNLSLVEFNLFLLDIIADFREKEAVRRQKENDMLIYNNNKVLDTLVSIRKDFK